MRSRIYFVVLFIFLFFYTGFSQAYRYVYGWGDSVNNQIENFLNSTLIIQERKVAVFDCDGTVFGQTPHYLADEALYSFAEKHYADKEDSKSKTKMKIIDKMLSGDNVGTDYVKDRIDFLSGMTTEEVERLGEDCFNEKYLNKFYPQMRVLISNLQEYGFEIWIISASPEILYQSFVSKALGIPKDRILGVRSVIRNDTVTDQIVYPVPQDDGKDEVIKTFIKAKPLFAAGNSRGDMEMMNTSVGLKMIVNGDDEKIEKGTSAGEMDGYTVDQYWSKDPQTVSVRCYDVPEGDFRFVTGEWGIKPNKSNP